jgi:hypothetical protein
MTGAVLDRAHTERFEFDDGLTLEELLDATLRTARVSGSAECPVCHAGMTGMSHAGMTGMSHAGMTGMRYTRAHARGGEAPVAECGGCGSQLS